MEIPNAGPVLAPVVQTANVENLAEIPNAEPVRLAPVVQIVNVENAETLNAGQVQLVPVVQIVSVEKVADVLDAPVGRVANVDKGVDAGVPARMENVDAETAVNVETIVNVERRPPEHPVGVAKPVAVVERLANVERIVSALVALLENVVLVLIVLARDNLKDLAHVLANAEAVELDVDVVLNKDIHKLMSFSECISSFNYINGKQLFFIYALVVCWCVLLIFSESSRNHTSANHTSNLFIISIYFYYKAASSSESAQFVFVLYPNSFH